MLDLVQEIEDKKASNLYRNQRVWDENLINFASNDYLSLSQDNRIKQIMAAKALEYGLGSGSSPMISGYFDVTKRLEHEFAEYLGFEDCILFNSGYHANLVVISSLLKSHTILLDKLSHASIIDGLKLAGSKYFRYPHKDLNSLERSLQSAVNPAVYVESMYSMEGKIYPAEKVNLIAQKYRAKLLIDDAHGIGVLGKNGGGVLEHFSIDSSNIACLIAPLGKAFASMGAIVAGNKTTVEYLRQFARSYIYSTALPPLISWGTLEVLNIIKKEHFRREKLENLAAYFNKKAISLGLNLTAYGLTPIRCVLVKDNLLALKIQEYLETQGFFVSCIRPPTVPNKTARIRVSLNYNHTISDINLVLEKIAEIYCE